MAPRRTSRSLNPIIAFTSTRRDGDAKRPAVLNQLLKRKKLPVSLATGQQVHGTHIEIVPKLKKTRKYPNTDGLLTAEVCQPLGIYTPDCASIFLSAPSQG